MNTLARLWHSLICGCHREDHLLVWRGWTRCIYPLMSAVALAWFLCRVIPKPIRATYPCQQAAFPLASTFILWLLAVKSGFLAWLNLSGRMQKYRAALGVAGMLCLLALATMAAGEAVKYLGVTISPSLWNPTDPPNTPMGLPRGIHPGRVVWVHDPLATTWDGNKSNGTYWWDQNGADQARVDRLLSRSLRMLTGTNNDAAAWDMLFQHFNQRLGRGARGYLATERIAIKINQNTARTGHPLNGNSNDEFSINGNPHLIKSMLRQLVHQVGVPETNITVYDASRWIGDNIYVPNHQEFPGVHFMDGHGGNGREVVSWSSTNAVFYAVSHSLGQKLPLQVIHAAYLINMSIMKDHGDGPTLTAKNHYGSINGQGDHSAIYQTGGMNSYANLVDLMGHQHLGEKTVLFMIDALYGSPTPDAPPSKWNMAPFNGWWPSSLFVSQDGVALDSVGFDFMNPEWTMAANSDNYLHEAAKGTNPPSGILYAPNGNGVRIGSLGVHEHWNNSANRQYSRNLNPNTPGIELLSLQPGQDVNITLTSPTNGSILNSSASITLEAQAFSAFSIIQKVDFYRAQALLGTVTNSPFRMTWTNPPVGSWPLRAVLTDSDGLMTTSAVVNVTVQSVTNVPPFILTHPAHQAVLQGGTALFAVEAGGWPAISYQWRRGSANLAGRTSASLSLSGVVPGSAGDYSVVLSNTAGMLTSAVARLAVLLPPTNVTLIATNALWRYFDKGQDLGTNWRGFIYTNENTWSNGYAELGYGDGERTTVSYGPYSTDKYPTTYFRSAFTAPTNLGPIVALKSRLLRDDGAVVYLNGAEAYRVNISQGTITYNTWASATVSGADESSYFPYDLQSSQLWPGANVLAVEIHQDRRDSSDISFAFELTAQMASQLPQILAPPVGQTRLAGESATFTCQAASATPMTCSWLCNGTPLSNATNSTLSLVAVTTNHAGVYCAVLANAAGCVTSAPAALVVVGPPQLTARFDPAQGFTLQFSTGGAASTVWTSTNLVHWEWWTNLPAGPGQITLPAPSITNRSWRFYRLRLD